MNDRRRRWQTTPRLAAGPSDYLLEWTSDFGWNRFHTSLYEMIAGMVVRYLPSSSPDTARPVTGSHVLPVSSSVSLPSFMRNVSTRSPNLRSYSRAVTLPLSKATSTGLSPSLSLSAGFLDRRSSPHASALPASTTPSTNRSRLA